MNMSVSPEMLLILFLIALIAGGISSLLFLHPKVPLAYIRIHLSILMIAPLIAVFGLFNPSISGMTGPFYLDSLAWLMVLFILSIGVIIQRFSIRYLLGDRAYRKYFVLFTLMTTFASLAWLSGDVRLMVAGWGASLVCLTLLIRSNREWKMSIQASRLTAGLFIVSWISLSAAAIWLYQVTGQWQLSLALNDAALGQLDAGEKTGINLLIVLAVIIPAAQFPFHRWLIESVVAPTPVSAIMHAGLVNAGGIILTRFSPLFTGDAASILLLVVASVSVLLGTGISLVQVDYKRQLVGSTIAQMGFMLIQCAIGAYIAAIIHLILHGIFKGTLFLQAGSAVRRFEASSRVTERASRAWVIAGWGLGAVAGAAFWLMDTGEGYRLISALILGWSLSVSWTQLIAFGPGKIGRVAGLVFIGITGTVYFAVHELFYNVLEISISQSAQPPFAAVFTVIAFLLVGSGIAAWSSRNRTSIFHARLYLWLVRLGEAKSVENHPSYLKKYVS
ncbi:NADH dehydrogenase subunit 5 [Jeotgalibacillus aurantiacus]|uniref:NADH dehydrogenase subunit 5 n=1 Tax=Jeotgalibacillus aurantiacus TaxID=2763266 RepID=UPI001D0A8294|nr:NADH dehydrogenase subunit 5 [Jeotgalibacillus aurantiacus]